jgi:AcrR family transcriptional regulator
MRFVTVNQQPIFETPATLPRGPHRLSREEVADSQRRRLLAAFTDLLAEHGYAAVTIGGLARRAGVSRAAFYEHFEDKEACMNAAYDHFAETLLSSMTGRLSGQTPWEDFLGDALRAYLGALERDPVAARAFIVEMDAAGPAARARRHEAVGAFARLFAERHAGLRERRPELAALPPRAYLGMALGVRELVRTELETERKPQLSELVPDVLAWISASVEGAR